MIRDLAALAGPTHDVLVIGGGIVGACVARDAARRGLTVALVERDDLASGASWNSLKTLHGGLRSLQHLDVVAMREYSGDRSAWMRIAPHLVDLLPVVMPTQGHGMRGRSALRAALAVSDLVALDRNRGLTPDRHFPRGRLLSRAECAEYVPECAHVPMTGGVLWYDAQMYSAERLVLEIVLDASMAGATVANYVEVQRPLVHQGRIVGVVAADRRGTGGGTDRVEIRARTIVNAAGSASVALAGRLLGHHAPGSPVRYTAAFNVMLPSLGHTVAFAVRAASGAGGRRAHAAADRHLFIVPWRGRTIIGTGYVRYDGDPDAFTVDERHADAFLEQVNDVWPAHRITRDALVLVHGGLLPLAERSDPGELRLARVQRIIDHASDGAPELITAVSVRFTTARRLAERLVDLVARKLRRRVAPCDTASAPLPGASERSVPAMVALARRRAGGLADAEVLEHLVRSYGTRYERILAYRDRLPGWNERVVPGAPVIRAQFAYAVEEEMAQCADDLVRRRTEIGARGLASDGAFAQAALALGGGVTGRAGLRHAL